MIRTFIFRLVVCLCLLAVGTLGFAQKGQHPSIEHLLEQLDLSSEQKAELEESKSAFEEQRSALKGQEFNTPEERREAHRTLKEQQRNALQEILTEEQLGKLMALHSAAKEEHRAAMKDVDRKGLHEALKAHHETEVLPVLREQRAKLEASISSEDRERIAVLRQEVAQQRAERKAERQAKKEARRLDQ